MLVLNIHFEFCLIPRAADFAAQGIGLKTSNPVRAPEVEVFQKISSFLLYFYVIRIQKQHVSLFYKR